MQIQMRAVGDVLPYKANPRKNDGAVATVARSLKEFGFRQPIVVDDAGVVIVGHTRLLAAVSLGMAEVPVHVAHGLTEAQTRAYRIMDNRSAENAEWDEQLLGLELVALEGLGVDLALTGFEGDELARLLGDIQSGEKVHPDELPAVPETPVTLPGDVWVCGTHRVMCGDSTNPAHVATLMDGERANLLHADPPYGMGKDDEGVLNDDLTGDALDQFQLSWWAAYRPYIEGNASAYLWGNAPELWRLWYLAGLGKSEPLTLRNEIVWDKKAAGAGGISHMGAEGIRQYPNATERCLFFMIGRHVFQINQTKDDYWQGWEPVRLWLCAERDAASFTAGDVKRICDNHMYGHWFTTSQWSLISEDNYAKLAAAANGSAFTRAYADLRDEYLHLQQIFNGEVRDGRVEAFHAARPYFDNTHDIMRDVWEFPRVIGEERLGHATPKPVAMIERAIISSCPSGGLVIEPFGGSGSTLIAAHKVGRRCYTMELQPRYVDVIVTRWQRFTGKLATLEPSRRTFAELKDDRHVYGEYA